MAVAISAASPAASTSATGAALTTASFTPPAGSLIVIVGIVAGTGATTGTVSDSLAGTWANVNNITVSGGGTCNVATRTTATSGAAMTVTWTGAGTKNATQQKVYVLTGASGSTGGTATATTSTTAHENITVQQIGSVVVMGLCYTNTGVALVVEPNFVADLDTNDASNGQTYGNGHLLTTATGSILIGWTNTTANPTVLNAVEFLPGGGVVTVPTHSKTLLGVGI